MVTQPEPAVCLGREDELTCGTVGFRDPEAPACSHAPVGGASSLGGSGGQVWGAERPAPSCCSEGGSLSSARLWSQVLGALRGECRREVLGQEEVPSILLCTPSWVSTVAGFKLDCGGSCPDLCLLPPVPCPNMKGSQGLCACDISARCSLLLSTKPAAGSREQDTPPQEGSAPQGPAAPAQGQAARQRQQLRLRS